MVVEFINLTKKYRAGIATLSIKTPIVGYTGVWNRNIYIVLGF